MMGRECERSDGKRKVQSLYRGERSGPKLKAMTKLTYESNVFLSEPALSRSQLCYSINESIIVNLHRMASEKFCKIHCAHLETKCLLDV